MQRLAYVVKQRWRIVVKVNGVCVEEFYENLDTIGGAPDTTAIEKYLRRKYSTNKILEWTHYLTRTIVFELYI